MDIIINIMAVCAGGLITYWVSKCYYQKSSGELKAEAVNLRRIFRAVCYFLENMQTKEGVEMRFIEDETGTPKGVRFSFNGSPAEALKNFFSIKFDEDIHEVRDC